jgi:hypothetical protein
VLVEIAPDVGGKAAVDVVREERDDAGAGGGHEI